MEEMLNYYIIWYEVYMEVYIEYVILDNLIINSILISLVRTTLRQRNNIYRNILGSVMGTIFAIFLPFINTSNPILFLIKMIVGLFIVMCFSQFGIKNISISYILFISYTFLMGGMCYFVLELFGIPVTSSGVLIYSFDIPVSIIILLVYVYYIIIKRFIRYRKNIVNLNYQVELYKGDKKLNLSGFLDTGSQIFDDDGKAIVVISLKSFLKCYPHISILKVATNNVDTIDLIDSKYMVISTANATTKMLTFKADKLKVLDDKSEKEFENITIGVSTSNFNSKFDCILHSEYI